jgi:hypothetical protein
MIYFWVEICVWLGTMFITSLAYFALARRYHDINPYKAAVPMANAKFMSRLALTNALNYLAFFIVGCYVMVTFQQYLPDVQAILGQWFIVEIFIFWNLRTAALIFMGLRNTKVEI